MMSIKSFLVPRWRLVRRMPGGAGGGCANVAVMFIVGRAASDCSGSSPYNFHLRHLRDTSAGGGHEMTFLLLRHRLVSRKDAFWIFSTFYGFIKAS